MTLTQRDVRWRANGQYLPNNSSKTGLVEEARQLLLSYARDGNVLAARQALLNGGLPQRSRATRANIILPDALGSLRQLTGPTGQLLGSQRYSPFGEVVEQMGSRDTRGFTGEPQDALTGLVNLRARAYQPALGRFLTPDSLVPDATDGQAWNRFAYTANDPATLTHRIRRFRNTLVDALVRP